MPLPACRTVGQVRKDWPQKRLEDRHGDVQTLVSDFWGLTHLRHDNTHRPGETSPRHAAWTAAPVVQRCPVRDASAGVPAGVDLVVVLVPATSVLLITAPHGPRKFLPDARRHAGGVHHSLQFRLRNHDRHSSQAPSGNRRERSVRPLLRGRIGCHDVGKREPSASMLRLGGGREMLLPSMFAGAFERTNVVPRRRLRCQNGPWVSRKARLDGAAVLTPTR
jgi:hypothetical protein